MLYIQTILDQASKLICSFNLTDIIEISVITIIVYYFSLWLKKDKQKNLLIPFYFFCIFTFSCFYLNLYILTYLFMTITPIILLLFIILHQETLQKNFISLQNKLSNKDKTSEWLSGFIGSCLLALNKNQDIVIVIERNSNISEFVKAPFKFYANLEKEIFQILLEKQINNDNYMIWINHTGKLIAINTVWNFEIPNQLSKEIQLIEKWKQKSLFLTTKTDTIIVKIISTSRKFDIIIKGKIAENLTSDQAFEILKSNLFPNNIHPIDLPKNYQSKKRNWDLFDKN